MANKQVGVRIVAEGGQQLKAQLADVGRTGQAAFGQLETAGNRASSGLQKASWQITDVFTQIASGTDPMRAVAIQLPQLLAGFGVMGAVLGTVAAIAPVAFQQMFFGASAADALKDSVTGATDAVDAYARASTAAMIPMDQMIQKYGDLAQQVHEVRLQESELARARAVSAVGDAMSALGAMSSVDQFSASQILGLDAAKAQADALYAQINQVQSLLTSENARFFDFSEDLDKVTDLRNQVDAITAGLSDMADTMGVSFADAQAIAAAFAEVEASAGASAQAQIEAGQSLIDTLVEAYGSIEAADGATEGLVSRLLEAVQAAADVAATDMAGPIGDAARAAQSLATALASSAAYSALLGRTGQSSGPDSVRSLMFGGGLRGPDGGFLTPQPVGAGLPSPVVRSGRGGGGGGGGVDREHQEALREAERLFKSTRTEAEKYAQELADIDRLLSGGFITQDTYNRALDQLKDKYGEVGDAAKFFGEINGQLKDAILDLATGGEAGFDQIAKSIRRAALEAALFGQGPMGEMFGGGLVNLLGSALGIKLPSFDGGGYTGPGGRSGGLDGRGGFMALLHPEETVIDHTRMRAVAARGGGTVVQVNNYTGQQVSEERSRGPNGEDLVRITVGKQLRRGEHDAAMRRFGASPVMVKR